MQNILITLILAGTLAGCCCIAEDTRSEQQQQVAIDRLLSKESAHGADDVDVFHVLHDQVGRDCRQGPLANITGYLIDINEVSETSCDHQSYVRFLQLLATFKDTSLGRYADDKNEQLRKSCFPLYQQYFISIASELDSGNNNLRELHSFVNKIDPHTRFLAHLLGRVGNYELIRGLRASGEAVRAVLDQCQLVYGRLREAEAKVRFWSRFSHKLDELTEKWQANYVICRELVGKNKGLGEQIQYEWSVVVKLRDSSMETFAHYLSSLPDEVALNGNAKMSDRIVTNQVVGFIENRMRSSADGVAWPKKSQERLERFDYLLKRLKDSCAIVSRYFQLSLWMLDAGAQLDKTDDIRYASQVLALKVARVCRRLPAINFSVAARQWNKLFSLGHNIKKKLVCGGSTCEPKAE